jgi:molecular chaperone GrpE
MKHPEDETMDAGAEETGVVAADTPDRPAPEGEEPEALRREVADLKDQLLRRRADFENYRRRVERDREQAALDAKAQVLSALLPTLDNLERALQTPGDEKAVRDGVLLIHRNFIASLESIGVVSKDPTGEPFDPQQHQALMHEPAPGFKDGTVVEAFRKAYFLKDRLLRPALVKVAKGDDGETNG